MKTQIMKIQYQACFKLAVFLGLNIFVFSCSFFLTPLVAQTSNPKIKSISKPLETFSNVIELKDNALDELINKDVLLEKMATGFGFTEGITWVPDDEGGFLLFSDMAANVIYRRDKKGEITTYLEKSGYQYQDIWRVGMRFNNGKNIDDREFEEFNLIGSDGMIWSKNGYLLLATWTGRSIDRLEIGGKRTTVIDRFEEKCFGGTNDLVELFDGGIYFTDTFGSMIKPDKDPTNELKQQGVYYFKDGQAAIRVIDDIPNTNGVAVSPDEKYLYANASVDRYIRRYEIQPDKTVKNGKLFIDLSREKGDGITDGMKVDSKGNIWTTGPGGIWIVSAEAKVLGRIHVPDPCTNLVFGDQDKKTLYISTPSTIYQIRTKVIGL